MNQIYMKFPLDRQSTDMSASSQMRCILGPTGNLVANEAEADPKRLSGPEEMVL